MVSTSIKFQKDAQNKQGSLKLNKWAKQKPALVKSAFRVIGSLLVRQITRNLSGESHSKHPTTSNPYPGVVTGNLRRSIRQMPENPWGVRVTTGGIASAYAEDVNDLYPFMIPSFEQKEDQVWYILKRFIRKPLR